MALQTVSNTVASRTFISAESNFDVLMRGTTSARIMSAELKDVGCPLIDLACQNYYRPTGGLIATGWGDLPEVEFFIIVEGRARRVLGAAVVLPQGLDVRLPLGFFQAPVVLLH